MTRLFLLLPIIFVLLLYPSDIYAQATDIQFEQICTDGQTKEGCAVQKLNHGLMPPEQAQEKSDPEIDSWLGQIGQALNNFVQSFFAGADNLKEGYIPAATPAAGAEESLTNTLAGPEGYYGSTLPTEEQLPEGIDKPTGTGLKIGPISLPNFSEINQDEQFFEQSYFPGEICMADGTCEKVCPITGQCNM